MEDRDVWYTLLYMLKGMGSYIIRDLLVTDEKHLTFNCEVDWVDT